MTFQQRFDLLAEHYIKEFVKKQGYEFDEWVNGDYEVACFISQYYIYYGDIRFDIDNNIEKGLIFKWLDDSLDDHQTETPQRISYRNYSMGLRFNLPHQNVKKI